MEATVKLDPSLRANRQLRKWLRLLLYSLLIGTPIFVKAADKINPNNQISAVKIEEKLVDAGLAQESDFKFKTSLVARTDWGISPVWSAKEFMGKDFRFCFPVCIYDPPTDPQEKAEYDNQRDKHNFLHYPLNKLPPNMSKYMDIPAFRDVVIMIGYVTHDDVITNPDGTLTFDLDKLSRRFPDKDQPFVVSLKRFVRPYKTGYKHYFYFGNYRHDQEKYQAWKAQHPNLFFIQSASEWGNEAHILYSNRIKNFQKTDKPTAEQMDMLKAKWPNSFTDRKDYVEKRLKPYLARNKETWFNDASEMMALDGAWCINHLAAYWTDMKILVLESSRSHVNWQLQLMFNRGAARQFDKFWGWYIASYHTGIDSKGQKMTDAEPAAWVRSERWRPGYGLSQNAIERAYNMAWLAGANIIEREDTDSNFWDRTRKGEDRWTLAPEGQLFVNFADFTRKNPNRGIAYTPVAFLVPSDQGAGRRLNTSSFMRFPPAKSDAMYNMIFSTVFKPANEIEDKKKGIEQTLINSPYGDIYDVLTPDFPDESALQRSLPAYKAAVLVGDYAKHPKMVDALSEYVRKGGTLILNAKQLANNFSPEFTGVKLTGATVNDGLFILEKLELAGAQPILNAPDGTPAFTAFQYGKGKVITAAPHWLVPDYDEVSSTASKEKLRTIKADPVKYKYTRILLEKLTEEVLPVKVSGDIQYGLNKTQKGWLLYLFNNKGIYKFTDIPETFDLTQNAKVSVLLKQLNVSKVNDLCTGETLAVNNNIFSLDVKPGRYHILTLE